MMFTVRWTQRAEDQLAEVWTRAPDRNAVTAAAREIDDLLKADPGDRGESRDGGRRVLLVPPLGVVFVVRDADQTVFVMGIWGFAKKSSSS
jgi:plasmid stabilization system protein ParE